MARSSDINQRIVLSGAEEVRRHLEEIGKAGERSGNATRAALLAATQGTNSFTTGARQASTSSGQMRFALQNLSFQVNDVATSLASGGDVMRVFAQQGGQIFQVFQQGGGARAVIGGAASAISSMITPMRLAAGGALALVAAIAALIARSVDSQSSAKRFNAQLEGLGKSSRISGEDLEKAAQRLRDIGLSADEARKKLSTVIAGGLADPKQAERIIRIGNDIQRVFGEGSMDEFIAAAAKGGEPLRQFAERLGLIPKEAAKATTELQTTSLAVTQSTQSIFDAISTRNQSIADEQRRANQEIADLTRRKGTAEEEIQLASNRRIEEINRQTNRTLNELIAARNAESQKKLAEYNQQIAAAAQKASEGGESVITQIENRVKGLDDKALAPTERATRSLGVAWNDMLNTLSQSQPVQSTITDLTNIFNIVTNLNAALKEMAERRNAALGAGGAPVATAPIPGFALGTAGTPPGTILVGERGPELISQPGGLAVWSSQQTERIMSAFKAFNMPVMPRTRRFAAGTVGAMAAAGGASVHIHLGDQSFPLQGERGVVSSLTRAARRSAMLSAGRKPSTA